MVRRKLIVCGLLFEEGVKVNIFQKSALFCIKKTYKHKHTRKMTVRLKNPTIFFFSLHGELVNKLRKVNVDMNYSLIYTELSHLFPMKNCILFNEVQESSF